MKPKASDALLEALRAMQAFWSSGEDPRPSGFKIASIERNMKSRGEADNLVVDFDLGLGVRTNDAYNKLHRDQKQAINTHFFWSAYNPIDGYAGKDWQTERHHEARHLMIEAFVYEANLKSAISRMELLLAL
ncbi:MAG: hypothetical protein ACRDAM_13225 [Casimicrobium sp.]